MAITVIGQVVAHRGLTQHVEPDGTPTPYTMRPDSYLREQPAPIPLHFDHDRSWTIGEVCALERSRSTGLMMVGQLDDGLADLLADGEWWLSDSTLAKPIDRHRLTWVGRQIREVSLVRRTANLGTRPIRWSRSDGAPSGMSVYWYGTWNRAHERMSTARYRRADRITILDLDQLDVVDEVLTDPAAALARSARTPPPEQAPAPKPKPTATDATTGGVRSGADAARTAAQTGVHGYSWTDEHGERRRVHSGGVVLGFA